MKTLLYSKPSLPLNLPKLPFQLWNSKTPNLHFLTIQNLNHPTRIRKLNANAKGFNSKKVSIEEKLEDKKKENKEPEEELPQEVFNRIIVRILVSVGVPLALGIVILKVLGYLKEENIWDVPLWVPFCTTLVTFGTSTLGLAYGSLSASWDVERRGSLLGLEEAKENWGEMWKEENND